jgi:phosphatidylserine/phosphatidylglycerophosphate/cardiolipin synthase-like enzyme
VGPEYSWDVLKDFLDGASESLVSAIYEFHGSHIAAALEERLDADVALRLVMDNASFHAVQNEDQEFDRAERFEAWERFGPRFARIVAPEGRTGLISDSYHIKVTVREDDTFWLSSGNWKMGSSQPIVTQEDRDNATDVDLPGNREWHVVVHSRKLAARFRNHIVRDFERSAELGGGSVPRSDEAAEVWVDVPLEESPALERRPPRRILEPQSFQGRIKVKPLLTPDKQGAVYSEAVLQLIRSARESLLFQIPYISMPSNPSQQRGFIDELLQALTQKLKTLPDARLLLRRGGQRYSAPTHAAWYLKSKGVDVANRVRQIEDHHTKGMIVDGKRVLIGSPNWSKPGVTLNRDASLLFDHAGIAGYYAEAFEIDWQRANPIRPKKFVQTESAILEAAGSEPPAGYRRVRLSELLDEEG